MARWRRMALSAVLELSIRALCATMHVSETLLTGNPSFFIQYAIN